jgi:hypothetical protein
MERGGERVGEMKGRVVSGNEGTVPSRRSLEGVDKCEGVHHTYAEHTKEIRLLLVGTFIAAN